MSEDAVLLHYYDAVLKERDDWKARAEYAEATLIKWSVQGCPTADELDALKDQLAAKDAELQDTRASRDDWKCRYREARNIAAVLEEALRAIMEAWIEYDEQNASTSNAMEVAYRKAEKALDEGKE